MNNSFPSYEEVQKIREQLTSSSYEHWVNHDFLTWKWWLLLALSILPWIIWWLLSDKNKRALLPADYTLVLTCLMLIYQWFSKWKSFVIANVIFGAFLHILLNPCLYTSPFESLKGYAR